MGAADLDRAFLGHAHQIKHAYGPGAKQAPASSAAESAPTRAPPPPKPTGPIDRQKLKNSSFVRSASDAVNSRFSDMFKAFQFADLDRSGTVTADELRRVFELWNLPVDDPHLVELIAACDVDGDGNIDYKEFVDVLARDTVAPAAMGKRGLQAQEAMGAADLDRAFLGHAEQIKHAYKMS